jgi:hypothetical protein
LTGVTTGVGYLHLGCIGIKEVTNLVGFDKGFFIPRGLFTTLKNQIRKEGDQRSVNFKMSFWYLQFSQKTNEKIQLYYYGTSSRIVFDRFLGELKTPKIHFEINSPLADKIKY